MSHHGRSPLKRTVRNSTDSGLTNTRDPHVQETARTEANRPVSAGAGRKRGDRRDTNPVYTTNRKHAARGNQPRKDVTTRAR